MILKEALRSMASVDLFREAVDRETFVGRPFHFDYSHMRILSNDHWKEKVGGIAAGSFLVAVYDNAGAKPEVILLRVLGPTPLPSDSDVVAAMVDHYKENAATDSSARRLDSYTRYEFQFSGLECRVLGSFYRDAAGRTQFGADVDNFYGPNNYSVYRPSGRVLEHIVNFRDGQSVPGGPGDQRIGTVRYASSRRHPVTSDVQVYVNAFDYLGKRTALFGMTRTGKSNTVKMIIKATAELSPSGANLGGNPVAPIGQIIFDVNGEYANDNEQDEGRAIYQLYGKVLVRAACACARVALPALRQNRRLAEAEIEAAEAWARGEISLDRVRAGAKAALAAYHAANTAPDGGYRRSGEGNDGFYAAYAAAACAFLEGEEYAAAAYHAAYAAHSACSRLRWSREYAEAEKETAQRVRALIPPPTLQGEE